MRNTYKNIQKNNLDQVSSSKEAWQFIQAKQTQGYYLYAIQNETCYHLGAFTSLGALAVQRVRFLDQPAQCVHLKLLIDELTPYLSGQAAPPRFIGVLGTAWSGYRISACDAQQVEIIYGADLRHEWLGVFSEAEAFEVIEQHYDRRRQRCLLC